MSFNLVDFLIIYITFSFLLIVHFALISFNTCVTAIQFVV